MANTDYPQKPRSNKERQEQSEFKRRSPWDVRQDNSASSRYSLPSRQPYRAGQGLLSHPLDINSDRSKKLSTKRRFCPATMWLEEPVRDEVDRIAQREGIARSKALRHLITWAVHQKLHLQTAALIPAVIEQSFNKIVGRRLAVINNLLVRAALDISQTRTIATNTLGRQPGVTPDTLNLILDNSLQKAKDDLTHRSPEMEIFIAAAAENRQKEEHKERDGVESRGERKKSQRPG